MLEEGNSPMPMLSHNNQIALAVITSHAGHSNSQQTAQESLANAQREESYAQATEDRPTQLHVSVNTEGVYTYRIFR